MGGFEVRWRVKGYMSRRANWLGSRARRWLAPVSRGAFYSVAKEFHLV